MNKYIDKIKIKKDVVVNKNIEKSFLVKNELFKTKNFQLERERLFKLFKNSGIYDFQINSVFFDVEIDSTNNIFSLPIKIIIEGRDYKVHKIKGEVIDLQNPSHMPDPTQITKIEEPWIKATIITPDEYLGSIIKICQDKRGIQNNLTYSGTRAVLNYELPLNEVVFDFYDRLKSVSSGYASFDYEITGYKEGN